MPFVYVNFYERSAFDRVPLSALDRLRLRMLSVVSGLVHCNVQIGSLVLDYGVHGYSMKNGYDVEPTARIGRTVPQEEWDAFSRRFAALYFEDADRQLFKRGRPWHAWKIVLASLPFRWCRRYRNCASFAGEITNGGERTPDRLWRKLAEPEYGASARDVLRDMRPLVEQGTQHRGVPEAGD